MPPKKSKSRATPQTSSSSSQTPPINPTSSFTPENFDAELRSLAAQARADAAVPWTTAAREQAAIYGRSLLLLVLAAASANASRDALSPVYGGIPADGRHPTVVIVACFFGWSANLVLRHIVEPRFRWRPWAAWTTSLAAFLPLIAAYLPVVQYYLMRVSTLLGARWGPALTEALSLLPLVAVSAACLATELDSAAGLEEAMPSLPRWLTDALPGMLSWGTFQLATRWTGALLSGVPRLARQLALAAVYAAMAPSGLLRYAAPALTHAAVLNVHVDVPALENLPKLPFLPYGSVNASLAHAVSTTAGLDHWTLLERRESITGYVSVLENTDQHMRVLRCDHSLLGGEWTGFPANPVAEPIYGVFVMLEAVRLVESAIEAKPNALVIGLGIGTSPAALVAHGIDTTVVEIDPAVHDFASRYFHLPSNYTAVIEDAVTYTDRAVQEASRYDYIVHDVFTGGAEPISLFTLEFLQNLHDLLKPTGVIAINYAGDLALTPIKAVVHTIRTVFPSCRIFREHPRDPDDLDDPSGRDFTNVVIFCTRSGAPVTFRRPTEADMLRSPTRRHFLMPVHEVVDADFRAEADVRLVRTNDTKQLSKWHYDSAVGHWQVMRRVLPAPIWELW